MSLGNLRTAQVVCTCLNGHITLKSLILAMQTVVSLDNQILTSDWRKLAQILLIE